MNVSGGLQSKGHPIAATGIANIWEVCHHLRGEAGDRQIEGAKVGLAHVIGLGSRLRRPHPGEVRRLIRRSALAGRSAVREEPALSRPVVGRGGRRG